MQGLRGSGGRFIGIPLRPIGSWPEFAGVLLVDGIDDRPKIRLRDLRRSRSRERKGIGDLHVDLKGEELSELEAVRRARVLKHQG